MSSDHSRQDTFLNELRKDRARVSIYLISGIRLQGQIEAFDQYSVTLIGQGPQIVYKHAISTIEAR